MIVPALAGGLITILVVILIVILVLAIARRA